jgi:hypothetical protein
LLCPVVPQLIKITDKVSSMTVEKKNFFKGVGFLFQISFPANVDIYYFEYLERINLKIAAFWG